MMKKILCFFILSLLFSTAVWSQALNKNIEPPKLVWRKFIQSALKGDVTGAVSFTAADLGKKIKRGTREDQEKFLKEEFKEFENTPGRVNELIGQGVNGLQASVIFKPSSGIGETEVKFVFNKKEKRWLIISYGKVAGTENSTVVSNIKKLKQIAIACWFYSNKNNGNFPETLSALNDKGLKMEEKTLSWTNSKNGEEKPFISCPGLSQKDSENTILAAAPEATDGKREVLFCNGTVSEINEDAFQAQVKKQKWELKPTQ